MFSADQGWEPLCRFLGVAVPSTPFPNVNDRAEIRRTLRMMKVAAYALLALGGIGAIALAALAARVLG